MSLCSKRAKQASLADRSRFTFIVGEECREYSCCLFQACLISQKVCEIVSSDPTCASLRVSGGEECNSFGLLENLWNGEEIEVDKESAVNLRKLCKELENDELGHLMADFELSSDEITVENAIPRLHLKLSLGIDREDELEFIASNLLEFSVSDLKSLTVSELEMILCHESLKVESENSLFESIRELMSIDIGYSVLLSYVHFDCLDLSHAEEFFRTVYPDFVNLVMWNSVTDFILKSMKSSPTETKKLARYIMNNKFEYDSSNPMNGIISHLRTECGGNPHEKGVVNITVSSTRTGVPKTVFEYDKNDQWGSQDSSPNEWIQFDFKNSSCSLSSYSIKSGSGCWPRKWVIECSNDASSWTLVDSRDTTEIDGQYITKHFSCNQCSNDSFRYIRMRLTGANSYSSSDYELRLSGIELFGVLEAPVTSS